MCYTFFSVGDAVRIRSGVLAGSRDVAHRLRPRHDPIWKLIPHNRVDSQAILQNVASLR